MDPDEILSPDVPPPRRRAPTPAPVVAKNSGDFPWAVFAAGVTAGFLGPKVVKGTTAVAVAALAAAWYATRD